jgi:PadR family transcriptional regulator AphA
MARTSRTPMVILGLLTIEPMSGYDIKATIDESIGHFWSESFGQLYPALKRLLEQGLVTCTEDAGEGGRKKKVYAITDAGSAALTEWLGSQPTPRFVRNELLLRMFFGHDTAPEVISGHLRREIGSARGMAAGLEGAADELRRRCADDPRLPYWLLTMDLGARTARARSEWAENAIATLEHLRRNA